MKNKNPQVNLKVLFLLINLLMCANKEYEIYLIAPSGKASSRMKESIINGLVHLKKEFKESNPTIVDTINNLEASGKILNII